MSEAFISLKPLGTTDGDLTLRPTFGSQFRKGAGAGLGGIRHTVLAQPVAEPEQPKKHPSQIIRYGKDFLLQFMDRYVKCPQDLQQMQLEVVISEDTERERQRQALKQVAEDDNAVPDERDWRSRAPLPPQTGDGEGGGGGNRQGGGGRGGGQQQQQASQRQPQQAPQQQQAGGQQQAAGGGAQQQSAAAAARGGQQPSQDAMRIHRAEEQGRTAYKVGGDLGAQERALRAVKGILNKLTPEKFERLFGQLLEVVTTVELLQTTISLVFENAVAQPTFCAMYADLCLALSKELPSFPPPPGDTKPVTFRRVLLNTCQDEFEAAEEARRELADITEPAERAGAEKRVKGRTIGTVRLIAELYRKDVVSEAIILVCIRELLEATPPKNVPAEDNIEAACEMITITGKLLSASDNKKAQSQLEGYLARLTRLGTDDKHVPSRLRFLIKDVLDMKRNKWVPRRETFTAKKLEEVHAEAEAELGIVTNRIAQDLPALPGQARMQADEFALLPPLRGGAELGWEYVGRRGAGGAGGGAGAGAGGAGMGAGGSMGAGGGFGGGRPAFGSGGSALVGEYRPPEPLARPAAPEAAAAAAPEAAAAPAAAKAAPKAAPSKPLSPEDITNKAKGLLAEYLSVGDGKEARLCLAELRGAPKTGGASDLSGVVEAGLAELFDAQTDKAVSSLLDLLVAFVAEGLLTRAEVVAGLRPSTSTLGDLALDVPKAPELLGRLVGSAAAACSTTSPTTGLDLAALTELLEGAEGAEAKRAFGAAAFKAFAAAKAGGGGSGGDAALAEAVKGAGLSGEALFAADEFDGDLPSVADWLKGEGLAALAL